MTLDPVQFKSIVRLVGRIGRSVDEGDHRKFAETVWNEFLDPLVDDGVNVLEPIGELSRHSVDIEDVALGEAPFQTQHGLDSGTINPTTFKNGVVIEVAQAAMSAVPSDLELHRARTVVVTYHTNDVMAPLEEGEYVDDEGYERDHVLRAPRVNQYEGAVVHELALYLAESTHALTQADIVDELLVLDGPIYPKGLLNWADREPELADLLYEGDEPRDVIENYVRLIERFVDREVPLIGFVKTPITRAVTRVVRRRAGSAPWVNDAAFFSQLLERRDLTDDGFTRRTDELTFTNWFASRGGADRILSTAGDALGIERELDPSAYEVTFFAVYDPRDDVLYRIETPYVFAKDQDLRAQLRLQMLKEVATERGPPLAIRKADELARIGNPETRALRDAMEAAVDAEVDTTYNDGRWGYMEEY